MNEKQNKKMQETLKNLKTLTATGTLTTNSGSYTPRTSSGTTFSGGGFTITNSDIQFMTDTEFERLDKLSRELKEYREGSEKNLEILSNRLANIVRLIKERNHHADDNLQKIISLEYDMEKKIAEISELRNEIANLNARMNILELKLSE